MPSVAVKLYSVLFKFLLKHRLQARAQTRPDSADNFGVSSRSEESIASANPTFSDGGVATKDIHIDPFTSLTVRIFLPHHSSLVLPSDQSKSKCRVVWIKDSDPLTRRNSFSESRNDANYVNSEPRRTSHGGNHENVKNHINNNGACGGYLPTLDNKNQTNRRLPVVLQFHGGGFVSGSNVSVANDVFCRRIAKLCDVIVVAVGYRLAPENRYPAAFEDGVKVLNWLGKQANLAECGKSLGHQWGGDADLRKSDRRHIANTLGSAAVEPWLAAHADLSRLPRKQGFFCGLAAWRIVHWVLGGAWILWECLGVHHVAYPPYLSW